ncbi:3191_t:CDS:2 [Ambispora leptoticha]|uniref:3191_t:CDS:1 n=1 Tax=Ambispora leptoticha TaxID=144679 RepID=A0A9N8VWD6_9GLOM|nr:3191_t:CDS:2 [Ambispora leptoticha]
MTCYIEQFPEEILIKIFEFVEDTDLPSLSRTNKKFNRLIKDAILQHHRLKQNTYRLESLLTLAQRRTREQLVIQNILRGVSLLGQLQQGRYINHTQLIGAYEAQSLLRRNFTRNRLSRGLAQRPELRVLLERNLVPQEAVCTLYQRRMLMSAKRFQGDYDSVMNEATSFSSHDNRVIRRQTKARFCLASSLVPKMKALKIALQRDKLSKKLKNRPSVDDMRRFGVMKTQYITKSSSVYPSLLSSQLLLLKSFKLDLLANSLTRRPSLSYLLDEVGILRSDATTASMICPGIKSKVQFFEQLNC